jgi:murein L,D-transpeptidase YafK
MDLKYLNSYYAILIIFCLAAPHISFAQGEFLAKQKTYSRVRTAFTEMDSSAKKIFADKNIPFPPQKIFLRAFKQEMLIELWAKAASADTFCLIKSYPVCSSSGDLGPKRRQGDMQVPEGFYHINRFNPFSNFYLSMGINYPNASDRILGEQGSLGGDIFIHGSCVTIGCLPITDRQIKELYIICITVKNNGQDKIPVHIFPCRLNVDNMQILKQKYNNPQLIKFWGNLQTGFSYFERGRRLPKIKVDQKTGSYRFD